MKSASGKVGYVPKCPKGRGRAAVPQQISPPIGETRQVMSYAACVSKGSAEPRGANSCQINSAATSLTNVTQQRNSAFNKTESKSANSCQNNSVTTSITNATQHRNSALTLTTTNDLKQYGNNSLIGKNIRAEESCVLAPRLPPAKVQQKVEVVTNIFPMEVEDRVVYRYDVCMSAEMSGIGKTSSVDLCSGRQDPDRPKKCMLLLRYALRRFSEIRGFAYVYDLSSSLFTNNALDMKEVSYMRIPSTETEELRALFGNNVTIRVEISECRDYAHTFRLTDFVNSVTPDLTCQDHSLRQFLELLTSSNALESGTYFSFGNGKLFLENGADFGLPEYALGSARKLLCGVDKGVRFIEGSKADSIVPALVIDSKKAVFFNDDPLLDVATAIWKPGSGRLPLLQRDDFNKFRRIVGLSVANLRLERRDGCKKTFIASGLSPRPVQELKVSMKRMSIPLISYYKKKGIEVRGDLPAVVVKGLDFMSYFPMEILRVASHQRVPLSKLTSYNCQAIIKQSAVKPNLRFTSIKRNLEALDLDTRALGNPIMAAFGVKINLTPLKVVANRRSPPRILYKNNDKIAVDRDKASWNGTEMLYASPAQVDNFFLFYDESCVRTLIGRFFERFCIFAMHKGIVIKKKEMKMVPYEKLTQSFNEVRNKCPKNSRNCIMYVDDRKYTHDDLKLHERFYSIVTQHVRYSTTKEVDTKSQLLENLVNKFNAKNFGQNYEVVPEHYVTQKWLVSGNTLVIGYDVCHPEPQSATERRLRLPYTQPSVIGFSYNAAHNPETFIGDYAFHESRKEQVTSDILEEEMFHILKLFKKSRSKLPNMIVITRDGVSEGQHKMVIEEELEAIRAGIRNYAVAFNTPNYVPNIVLITVIKRHNKRFFLESKNGVMENCLPGTVIDHTVTRLDVTEAFMQSHRVIQGTGKIPAYTILVNEANLDQEELQSFLNALCHTHQIVNSAVSIPEPVYQADEWAKRGRNNFARKYSNGKSPLPYKNETVDWRKVTEELCYKDSLLELTRANA